MARDYDIEAILGIPFEETPETMAYDMSAQFSAQVSAMLDEKGMSYKDLADRMDVAQSTLCKMLGPKSNMTMKTMAKIAMALGCECSAPVIRQEEAERENEERTITTKDLSLWVNPAFSCRKGERHARHDMELVKEG